MSSPGPRFELGFLLRCPVAMRRACRHARQAEQHRSLAHHPTGPAKECGQLRGSASDKAVVLPTEQIILLRGPLVFAVLHPLGPPTAITEPGEWASGVGGALRAQAHVILRPFAR